MERIITVKQSEEHVILEVIIPENMQHEFHQKTYNQQLFNWYNMSVGIIPEKKVCVFRVELNCTMVDRFNDFCKLFAKENGLLHQDFLETYRI